MYIHSYFVKINLVCLWVTQCEKIDLGQLTISDWGQSRGRINLGEFILGLLLIEDNQRKNLFGKINSRATSLIGNNQRKN